MRKCFSQQTGKAQDLSAVLSPLSLPAPLCSAAQTRFRLRFFSVFKLIRVSNWVKNLLIFFPLIFGKKLTDAAALQACIAGFLAFSLLSSAVYVINDTADLESDRRHPTKCRRPLASGAIPLSLGYLILGLCLAGAVSIAAIFLNPAAWLFLGAYFGLNLLYSFRLKHVSLLDVFLVTVFFELRLFLGGELANVDVSHWLALLTFFLAAFVTFSKRRDDVVLSGEGQAIRKSIRSYNLEFLNAIILLLASVLLITYILYTLSDTGAAQYDSRYYTSSFFVFLGICRYLQLILVLKQGGDPVRLFYRDPILMLAWIGWLGILVYFIYF